MCRALTAADAVERETSASAADAVENTVPGDGLQNASDPAAPRNAAEGVNAFSIALFKSLAAADSGNLVVSPYSLECVLAMAAYGAKGETRREMLDALSLPRDGTAHAGLAGLTRAMNAFPDLFSTANLLAHSEKFALSPEYAAGVADMYRAEILPQDFSDSGRAAAEINAWAAEKTRGGIRDIVAAGDIAPDTRLILLNAMVFTGEWADPFPPDRTREGDFETKDGPVAVKYMSMLAPLTVLGISGEAAGGETGEGKALASLAVLPFRGGEWEMLLFAAESVEDFLAELSPETFRAWVSGYDAKRAEEEGRRRLIQVELPKFAFSSEAKDVIPTLRTMGMSRAFDQTRADFSGLAGEGGSAALSLVRHKARIEVDEAGARAAAVSAAGMTKSLVEHFSLRRPFVFMIRHVPTGAVAALGRVARPIEE